MPTSLIDTLDAATAARARKDCELERLDDDLAKALANIHRLEAVIREVAYERDELAKAEDAAYEAFIATGGHLDLSTYETRTFGEY